MPNIKSAKKRVLVAKAANDINKANKSLLKTNVKKFEVAAASGDKEAAAVAAKVAIATIDNPWARVSSTRTLPLIRRAALLRSSTPSNGA